MSTSTQFTTFSDLYTGLLNRVQASTSSTDNVTMAKQFIQTAHQDMYVDTGEKLPWAERRAYLTSHPEYSTGTVTISQGSQTLTGSSTAWNTNNALSQNNMQVGGKVTIAGSYEVYEVTAVASDTSATISPAYIGSDATSASYNYFEDEYALASDFLRPLDWRQFDEGGKIGIIGRQDFRKNFPRNRITSDRILACCILDLPPSGDTTPIKKVQFAPPPNDYIVIPYSYVTKNIVIDASGTSQQEFSADTDEPIMDLQYRHIILLHGLYNWYRDKRDDARSQEVRAEYDSLLGRIIGAREIGQQRARWSPSLSAYSRRARSPWRRRSRTYDVNGEFDRFEC